MEVEDWPEELKYVERMTDMNEVLFGMNLYAHNRAHIDYSILCLEAIDLWLNRMDKGAESYSAKQNVAITSVLKGRRLLRAGQLQLFKGYLPESEILARSIFEVQLVLGYILADPTDKRVNTYLADNKKTWDFRTLCNEFMGEKGYEIYKGMSQYPHPFNSGRIKLIRGGQLQRSSIHDYEHAGFLLVHLGNSAVGLCEQSNVLFDEDVEWNKKHQEIYGTEIFKKNIEVAKGRIETGEEIMLKALSKLDEAKKNHNKI